MPPVVFGLLLLAAVIWGIISPRHIERWMNRINIRDRPKHFIWVETCVVFSFPATLLAGMSNKKLELVFLLIMITGCAYIVIYMTVKAWRRKHRSSAT
jgi:hypothetical protein